MSVYRRQDPVSRTTPWLRFAGRSGGGNGGGKIRYSPIGEAAAASHFRRRFRRTVADKWLALLRWWPVWGLVLYEVAMWTAANHAPGKYRSELGLAAALPLLVMPPMLVCLGIWQLVDRHRPKFSLRTLVVANLFFAGIAALVVDVSRDGDPAKILAELLWCTFTASVLAVSVWDDQLGMAGKGAGED